LANAINITLAPDLVEKIDQAAGKGKRSNWIAEACRQALLPELHSGKLWYLAHPYTKPSPDWNVRECIDVGNKLIDAGYSIYAPIVMTHWFDKADGRPCEFWYEYDLALMERCDGCILSPGWDKSTGCTNEKKWFEAHGKPVLTLQEALSAPSPAVVR
jgi:hypothetical protein